MGISLAVGENKTLLTHFQVIPILIDQIRDMQDHDAILVKMKEDVKNGLQRNFSVRDYETLVMGNRLCVPSNHDLKKQILEEAHSSAYVMHPGSTNMNLTLKDHYWWQGMKREIAEFVSHCLTCQQVKTEHQRPAGLSQPLPIPEWK